MKNQKPMIIMLLALLVLFGGIFAWKYFIKVWIARSISQQSKAITVSTMIVGHSDWQQKVPAPGSIRAIKGVNVTTELAGMIQKIYFTPGSQVKEGELLVQLNNAQEMGVLQARKADADLARLTYERDKKQLAIQAISKQILDNDEARLRSAEAQVAEQQAIVNKKAIRAAFAGYVGLNYVNPGQYINPGDKVTTLQNLNPLYCDFFLPQQFLEILKVGQTVLLHLDGFNTSFEGKISTIEPQVDNTTRNVAIEATLDNKKLLLKPGMFVDVDILIGKPEPFLTVPQTAITFNSFGNLIYIVTSTKNDKGAITRTARQRFVTTGETRGEQIQVLKGLKKGEEIVTSGQLKLHNGSEIIINNRLAPSNNPHPVLNNNH